MRATIGTRTNRRANFHLISVAVAVAVAAAALLTAFPLRAEEEQRRSATILLDSDVADHDVGSREAERVEAEMGLVREQELAAYVNRVGGRLLEHARVRSFGYEFRIVDQSAPNAFALPGGFIHVSRGLLVLANTEDELANVLGHEIIHVAERHAAARQYVEQTAVNPMMLPGIVLGAVLGEGVGKAVAGPFRVFSAPYVARYSRDQERSADRGGQELAASAGYDPAAMSRFLRSLRNTERIELGYSRLPSFLDTHPATSERVGSTASYAQLLAWSPKPAVAAAGDGYLGQVDGLVVGERAAEGVFRGERFLHPDLDFSIRFPRGWKLVNADRAVGAISPDRRVQIFLSAPTKVDDPKRAAHAFLAEHGRELDLRIGKEEPLWIGALPAHRIQGSANGPRGRMGGQMTWIAYRGLVYRLTAVAPMGIGRDYLGRARSTARSFRALVPEERTSFRENRLRLARANEGETLEALDARTGNEWGFTRTAVMNGQRAGAPLQAGQIVKIARSEPYEPTPGSAD